jgi:hypothetical protein
MVPSSPWSAEEEAGRSAGEFAHEQRKNAIRVRVNEVIAPVTVTSHSGEMILDLSKDNFRVYDNGVQQKIEHFDLGGDPLSVVLAVETSSHIEPMLPAVRQTGIIFTETVMGQTAEAAVISFDSTVELLKKFTTDVIRSAGDQPPAHLGVNESRLYDAMSTGYFDCWNSGRRCGGEFWWWWAKRKMREARIYRLGEVLRQAQLANVTIYTIGLSTAMADLRAKRSP